MGSEKTVYRFAIGPLAAMLFIAALGCKMLTPASSSPTEVPGPTIAPTSDISSPVTVNGAKILIIQATNDTNFYDSGPFQVQHAPDETVLHVEAMLMSGTLDFSEFAKGISLVDENGKECQLISFGTDKLFWEFLVPVASKSFKLVFPDGQSRQLDSILKLAP